MTEMPREAAQALNLVIIGCGKLATALLLGLLRSRNGERQLRQLNVVATVQSTQSQERLKKLFKDLENDTTVCTQDYQISFQVQGSDFIAISLADVVILGCKPSAYEKICCNSQFRSALEASPGKILVSLVGGTSCHKINLAIHGKSSALSPQSFIIVRAIPNIAAQIRQSVTTLSILDNEDSTAEVREAKSKITQIFSAVGTAFWVPEEAMAVTSTIGASALAFFAVIMDQVAESANASTKAIPADVIKQITAQAAYGAAGLALHGISPHHVVEQVATKGGSTRAGLNMFDKYRTSQAVNAAVRATIEATRSLSDGPCQPKEEAGDSGWKRSGDM